MSGRADFGKGSPVNPMTDDELPDKFRECAAWGRLTKPSAEKIVDLVLNLEKVKSIRQLTRLLSLGGPTGKSTARTRDLLRGPQRKA
ncbi:MAG TPA: hypothetical protein VD867_10275 [Burkholderiales bacterium]|nr:hypothetical protein [Burkholderiales bacterium]